jgi:hypothetical protein
MLGRIPCRMFLAGALMMAGSPALGCPLCDREGGREVRAGLFGRDFAANLLACVAPFPFFLAIAALIHGSPARRPTHESPTTTCEGEG